MTKVWCDNFYCQYSGTDGICKKDAIAVTNNGQPKVFILDCVSYKKVEGKDGK